MLDNFVAPEQLMHEAGVHKAEVHEAEVHEAGVQSKVQSCDC